VQSHSLLAYECVRGTKTGSIAVLGFSPTPQKPQGFHPFGAPTQLLDRLHDARKLVGVVIMPADASGTRAQCPGDVSAGCLVAVIGIEKDERWGGAGVLLVETILVFANELDVQMARRIGQQPPGDEVVQVRDQAERVPAEVVDSENFWCAGWALEMTPWRNRTASRFR
jgi:hypothetical protein